MKDKAWICSNCGAQNTIGDTKCIVCSASSPVKAHSVPEKKEASKESKSPVSGFSKADFHDPSVKPVPGSAVRKKTPFHWRTWLFRGYFLLTMLFLITNWANRNMFVYSPDIWINIKTSFMFFFETISNFVMNIPSAVMRIDFERFRVLISSAFNMMKDLFQSGAEPGTLLQNRIFSYLLLSILWIIRVCTRKLNCLENDHGSIVPLLFEVPVFLLVLCWLQNQWGPNSSGIRLLWQQIMAEMSLFAAAAALISFFILAVWRFYSNSAVKTGELIGMIILFLSQVFVVNGMMIIYI